MADQVQGTQQQGGQVSFEDVARQFQVADGSDLIRQIEEKRGSRVLSLVYNESAPAGVALALPLIDPLEQILRKIGRVPKLDLFLRSTGGVAEVPWRVVSLLREFTEELGVIVGGMALSGAAHIAIAADELVMPVGAYLGPVDPTRSHPLLPPDKDGNPIPTSVQDLKHLIIFIREQFGASYEGQDLALVVSELFKYVNPLAIGAIEQTYALSRLITRKVLGTRREPLSEGQVSAIEEALAGRFYSHAFYISRADAETDLHLPVVKPDDELDTYILQLKTYYKSEFSKAVAPAPDVAAYIAGFLQTTDETRVITQVLQNGQVLADPWITL